MLFMLCAYISNFHFWGTLLLLTKNFLVKGDQLDLSLCGKLHWYVKKHISQIMHIALVN